MLTPWASSTEALNAVLLLFLDNEVGGMDTERKLMISFLPSLVGSTATQTSRRLPTMCEERGEGSVQNRFLSLHSTSQLAICA